ncbi:MAG: sensor domain-containing diguanylate cyclase [Elusimicrobiota bacterium]
MALYLPPVIAGVIVAALEFARYFFYAYKSFCIIISLVEVLIGIMLIYHLIEQYHKVQHRAVANVKHIRAELENTNRLTHLLLGNFEYDKPLEKMVKTIIENLTKGMGFDDAMVYLLEGSEMTGILRCIATRSVFSMRGIDRFTLSFITEEAVLNDALRSRDAKIVQDVDTSGCGCSKEMLSALKLKQFILVPMHIMNKVLGLVVVGNTAVRKTINHTDIDSAKLIVNQASVALHLAQLYQKIQEMTVHDELTGVYNHRYFKDVIRKELDLAHRYTQPLSVSIIDIDNFKHYNDTNGHVAGDGVLRQVAQLLSKGVRKTDIVARYGGEEFGLIFPATDKDGALIVLEKLRKDIESFPFPFGEKQPQGKLTISLGVSTFPVDAAEIRDLIEFADKGLYIAKNNGKNRIGIYKKAVPEG